MNFEQIYASLWHHPLVCLLGVLAMLALMLPALPFWTSYLVGFGFVIVADALTSSGVCGLPVTMRDGAAAMFVVLGDWRYFLLMERYKQRPPPRFAIATSLGMALLVPAATAAATLAWPRLFGEAHPMYLLYELMFVGLASLLWWRQSRRHAESMPGQNARFLRGVYVFFVVQYGLWAVADALIIAGYPVGFGLRLIANSLYYGGFLLFVLWTIPDGPPLKYGKVLAPLGLVAALGVSGFGGGAKQNAISDAALAFALDDQAPTSRTLAQMLERQGSQVVSAFDPYYGTQKRWLALDFAGVLQAEFELSGEQMKASIFELVAHDGYTVTLEGALLFSNKAYLAYGEDRVGAFEPIGEKRANPGPFYLVWQRAEPGSHHAYPRPWQLAKVQRRSRARNLDKITPKEPTTPQALSGFALFKDRCLRCHAVNGLGGTVGPELNVPRSIVEYRTREEIVAYIRDPQMFRYSVMPAHKDFSPADFDDLLAYFTHMKTQKEQR